MVESHLHGRRAEVQRRQGRPGQARLRQEHHRRLHRLGRFARGAGGAERGGARRARRHRRRCCSSVRHARNAGNRRNGAASALAMRRAPAGRIGDRVVRLMLRQGARCSRSWFGRATSVCGRWWQRLSAAAPPARRSCRPSTARRSRPPSRAPTPTATASCRATRPQRCPEIAARFDELDQDRDSFLSASPSSRVGATPPVKQYGGSACASAVVARSRSLCQYTSSPPSPSRLARFSTRASTNSRSDRRFRYWRGSARTASTARQRHHRALGAARDRAADMRERRAARAGRQDELLQPRQRGVVVRERLVEPQHRVGLQQLVAGDRQLAAEVEQLVLDHDEQLAHVVGQRLGEQHAELRVQLVDVAHRLHAQVVLGHAACRRRGRWCRRRRCGSRSG